MAATGVNATRHARGEGVRYDTGSSVRRARAPGGHRAASEQDRKGVQDLSCWAVLHASPEPRGWLRRIISGNAFGRS
jgi:hypothetical protein